MKTTIRFQILLVLNTLLAVFVAGFLAMDYRRELTDRFDEKRIALEEEAKTLLPAAVRLSRDGKQAVQEYVDAVCHRMRDTQSPGHHIAVRLDQSTLQATAHHRASSGMLDAMKTAAQSQGNYARTNGFELIVGTHEQGDIAVYVSEEVDSLRESVFQDEIRRLGGVIFLAALAAIVINVALIRIVARPLARLVSTVRSIGRGHLDAKAGEYQSIELSYLASEIDAMSGSLAAADQERATQMAKARQIQQNLLPTDRCIAGMRISHIYEAATDVAGDYFDILDLDSEGCLICIADVTGHGVPAAMSAAMLKTLLAQAAKISSSPSEILAFINDSFVDVTLDEDFATMLLMRFDANSMKIEYASAGHESGWLLGKDGKLHELGSTGIMLGVYTERLFETKELTVRAGDRLFAYTDGLPETFNAKGEYLGRDSLPNIFREASNGSTEEASERIKQAGERHRESGALHDDVTFFVAEFE